MRIFSRITPLLLALAIALNAVGQIQTASEAERTFSDAHQNNAPAYWNISTPILWAVVNMEKEASNLLTVNSLQDSEEDRKNHSKLDLAQESVLERYASVYLILSRAVIISPSVSELLYPFHFYF